MQISGHFYPEVSECIAWTSSELLSCLLPLPYMVDAIGEGVEAMAHLLTFLRERKDNKANRLATGAQLPL